MNEQVSFTLIWFERMEYTWVKGKCTFCGASQVTYDRSEGPETHAYASKRAGDVRIYQNDGTGYVARNSIPSGTELIDKWRRK